MTRPPSAQCNAMSPTVAVGDEPPRSYRCELLAHHGGNDLYHRNNVVTWRDPEPILGEPHPWNPQHAPHRDNT